MEIELSQDEFRMIVSSLKLAMGQLEKVRAFGNNERQIVEIELLIHNLYTQFSAASAKMAREWVGSQC